MPEMHLQIDMDEFLSEDGNLDIVGVIENMVGQLLSTKEEWTEEELSTMQVTFENIAQIAIHLVEQEKDKIKN